MGLTRATTPFIFDITGREGATVMLPPGTYSAICHNSDSDKHGFVNRDSYEDFGLALSTVRSQGGMGSAAYTLRISADERIAHSPDSIWVGAVDNFIVQTRDALLAQESATGRGDKDSEGSVGGVPVTVVSITMQSVVQHYKFIIRHPINISTASSFAASVSGMPSTVHPGRGMTGEETVTHSFGMYKKPDGSLCGELLTFGHCSAKPIVTRAGKDKDLQAGSASRAGDDPDRILHLLKIQVTHKNGELTSSSHDVTGQIHEYEDSSPGVEIPEIVVELDTVVIPPPTSGIGGGGGGFTPTVGGWTGTQETLGM